MTKTKQLWLIFLPAILIAALVLGIRVLQYEPLYPKERPAVRSDKEIVIPIFPDDPILGYKKAPKTIVIFEDFGCPACAEQMRLLNAVMEKHPQKIRIVWKGLSVIRIPYASETAHRYGFCANEQQAFQAFAEYLFSSGDSLSPDTVNAAVGQAGLNTDRLSECLDSPRPTDYLHNTSVIAEALDIQSVPAIFVDNKQITPPQFVEGWETFLGL